MSEVKKVQTKEQFELFWRDSVVIKFMRLAQSMVGQLIEQKYSTVDADSIENSINLITSDMLTSPAQLLDMFLQQAPHWDRAMSKDIKFILEDLPKIFAKIDTKALIEPIRAYENREALIAKVKSKKPFPIRDIDYTSYWNLIISIIKGAYAYNKNYLNNAYDLSAYKSRIETKK